MSFFFDAHHSVKYFDSVGYLHFREPFFVLFVVLLYGFNTDCAMSVCM